MEYVLVFLIPVLLAGFLMGAFIGVAISRHPSRSTLWNGLKGMLLGIVTVVLFFLFLPLVLSLLSDGSGGYYS